MAKGNPIGNVKVYRRGRNRRRMNELKKWAAKHHPALTEECLTDLERKFVEAYAAPSSDCYMKTNKAAIKAGYACGKDNKLAYNVGGRTLRRPRVMLALKELLNEKCIDDMIHEGVKERLKDYTSRGWISTAEFVAKIRGDFAPEKSVQLQLTQEDRASRYDEIMKKIEGK